ncbi:uncharacterized protein [Prorops nasuta]|uniref:uncharacterized protein isoform X1 n=1 Tax=Prorops nasuta TaxID=863751 RepID=UPI0034CFAB6C
MPGRHQVPTLINLSLNTVGILVITIGKNAMEPITKFYKKNAELGKIELRKVINQIKFLLLSTVPCHLYDEMVLITLTSIMKLLKDVKEKQRYNTLELNIIIGLIETVITANLKSIEFSMWPKIMRNTLYNKLYEMSGLEVLDLGSGSVGWKTSDVEKIIVAGVSSMINLVCFILCFDCTDNIITALAENCRRLQKLDVTASRSVTDRSVSTLLKCKYLKEIKLFRTSMTVAGYAELFLQHNCLEDIGRCDQFGYALEHLVGTGHPVTETNLSIKIFESRSFTLNHIQLLIYMCQDITSLAILRDEETNDLQLLAFVANLRELKLLSCKFYTHEIKTVLRLRGREIVSLHLEHVDEIDIDALIYISQFCPNIKSLIFYNCEFLEHVTLFARQVHSVPPFQYLERIKCVADCASMHLEFLLSSCKNIKFIQLGSSTGMGDATMRLILSHNPMQKLEELKVLYSHDLSMGTVQLLMQNCHNLRRLSELESWEGITPSELRVFREHLKINNINLDTSATLSFA